MTCPFARLGLAPDATSDLLAATWRRLARAHHPDLRPGDPAATAAFQDLSDARDRAIALLRQRLPETAATPADMAPSDDLAPRDPLPSWRARAAEVHGWRARRIAPPPWRAS
jgi:hypothetical protein